MYVLIILLLLIFNARLLILLDKLNKKNYLNNIQIGEWENEYLQDNNGDVWSFIKNRFNKRT